MTPGKLTFVQLSQIKRKIRIVTKQHINHTKAPIGDFPIRDWTIEVYLLDAQGNPQPATLFDKVTYHLHESFGKKAVQTFKAPPFKLSEQGWGEFELRLTFHPLGKGSPDVTVPHDLNFLSEVYNEDKEIVGFESI
jgi:transcription initiation factor IIF auxiliary subunit